MALESDDIDIDRYIPFRSIASMESFSSNDDGLLSRRKYALMKRIQSGANTKDVSKFNGSLCRILFDPDFMVHHKWPLKK